MATTSESGIFFIVFTKRFVFTEIQILSVMHWRIITVGKPGHPWVKEALGLYLKRLEHYTRVEHVIIKDGPLPQVEAQIQSACSEALCILLDERGKSMRSLELARWVDEQELAGRKRVCVVIGGADGHSPSLREMADHLWCLSSFTLQHDLAFVLIVEQLFRAYNILRGGPYHRE